MNNQKSFNYQFNDDFNELNFYVNKTNFYAFNGLINNDNKLSFLYGPKKSGKSFLSYIWLKKNNGIKFNNNFEYLLNNKRNVLIDDFFLFDEEIVFHIVNNSILNNNKLLITSNIKINEIKFKFVLTSKNIFKFNNKSTKR